MILLDTQVWFWWVQADVQLPPPVRERIGSAESTGIGVSAISCWEIAMLVAKKRLELGQDVQTWLDLALAYPGMQLLPLTPRIAVESTRLPGEFHGDPADRIVVATAITMDIDLATTDGKIRKYPHVRTVQF